MPFAALNPKDQTYLGQQGLTEPAHFLALPGVIVTGHPQRHVLQLTLGAGASALPVFLKKEHRVAWKDRLANAWAGFGFVSKSRREAATLQALAQAGISCPEWIAAGEDATGQAFLLVREWTGGLDLRHFLQQPFPAADRRRWAQSLGETLARLHATGFNHPDLNSKHVLVRPEDSQICFLDWQRSRRWTHLSWQRRGRDLAALNATLADDLASPRERLLCLRAYCQAAGIGKGRPRRRLARFILRQSERLLRRRRVRELRQPPLQIGAQSLIWLDGEALCVTPEFHARLGGKLPAWLKPAGQLEGVSPDRAVRSVVPIPEGRTANLVCRRVDRPQSALARFLRRQPPPSPELDQVGLLYRLQRYGIGTPKLLAFGQRTLPDRTDSFLLTEPLANSVGLLDWLADRPSQPLRPAERRRRWRLIREAAAVLQTIHAAGYALDPAGRDPAGHLCVRRAADGAETVAVNHAEGLHRCRHGKPARALRDMARLFETLPAGLGSRTEMLRFLLAYLGQGRLTAAAKRTVRRILQRTFSPQQVTLWTSPCATRASCPPAAAARHTLPT